MIGIVSYGGYIPRLRLDRMSIFQTMGWLAPAIVMVAQGERSFCNWDEDGVTMAVAAAKDCLKGMDKTAVDACYLCSTTLPYLDRLNAGIVKTALNLRDDITAQDVTSCLKAGTTGLVTALSTVGHGGAKQALVMASDKREAKAAYFYEMWFGDGAAAMLVGDDNVIAEFKGSYSTTHDFIDHFRGEGKKFDYMWEERWVRDAGYSRIIPEAVHGLFNKLNITMDDVDTLVFPCFFKAEHRKIAAKLGATPEKVIDNLHEECGETGTAHPLAMFAKALDNAKPGDRILVAGFGQGCDALYFQVTDKILDLPERMGIEGSLARKRQTTNYAKYLKFRDLLPTEMGIRAECPTQTAMTVLWRQRKMLGGMIGGKCRECGTPQIPRMDVCVNPACKAINSQDDYEFQDVPAKVKSFTGDMLAVSLDPPAIYGMVEFEGGGRYMADFTDCELEEVKVGQSVELAYRKRYTDEARGFTGYFWKAIPLPSDEPEAAPGEEIRFDGKVAVVTGAGAGLGRMYAIELAKRGAKVVVNDLGGARDGSGGSAAPADEVVKEITDLGGEAVASYDSVAVPEGGEAIIKKALDEFGRVDVLINNAGILRDKTLAKMEPDEWRAIRAVHLDGAYNVTRPAFKAMREQGYGRIIMTTSAAGLYGNFGQTNYSAAKMALVGLINTLKLEGDKYNIKVNCIAPVAMTRLTEDVLPPDLQERLKPEFVTPPTLYLSSDKCEETGMIFNAGMGDYNRAAIVTGPGAVVGDGATPPTPEEIHHNWAKINDLTGAVESYNATAALGDMLSAFSPKEEKAEAKPSGEMTAKTVFDNMPSAFQPDKAEGVDAIFQYKIDGPKGGNWHVVIKDKTCAVYEGLHDKPTTTIIMSDEDFISLIKGKLDPMKAFTSGKLKVEGDIMKSQLIQKLFKF